MRAGYIYYLVGQVETMEISQARVVLERICPVGSLLGLEGRAVEKGFTRRQLLRGILRSERVRAPPVSGSSLVQNNSQESLKSPKIHQ